MSRSGAPELQPQPPDQQQQQQQRPTSQSQARNFSFPGRPVSRDDGNHPPPPSYMPPPPPPPPKEMPQPQPMLYTELPVHTRSSQPHTAEGPAHLASPTAANGTFPQPQQAQIEFASPTTFINPQRNPSLRKPVGGHRHTESAASITSPVTEDQVAAIPVRGNDMMTPASPRGLNADGIPFAQVPNVMVRPQEEPRQASGAVLPQAAELQASPPPIRIPAGPPRIPQGRKAVPQERGRPPVPQGQPPMPPGYTQGPPQGYPQMPQGPPPPPVVQNHPPQTYPQGPPSQALAPPQAPRPKRHSSLFKDPGAPPAGLPPPAPWTQQRAESPRIVEPEPEPQSVPEPVPAGVPDGPEPVQGFQYHHNMEREGSRGSLQPRDTPSRPLSTLSANNLTPDAHRRSTSPNLDPNRHHRSPSNQSANRKSPENRLSTVDLLSLPYQQQAPPSANLFNHGQLQTAVGSQASLLSQKKTLEMYRANIKKTNNPEVQYSFAIFMVETARELMNNPETNPGRDLDGANASLSDDNFSPPELVAEARQILQRLSDKSYPFAQYYLADGYASGAFNKGKEDNDRAFPLFVAASKHGHAEAGYRAALCYEFGWGTRKDPLKAVQFYRQSASKNHPGAMVRLGRACMTGDLGLQNRYREGVKWLKRAAESADFQYNSAPYELGVLHETGYGDDIFKDETYAAQLFTQSADLGHAEASYRLGDAYEHGKLACPRDPALSVHFYNGAASRGHPLAMMALCAWYMVGAEPVLEKDEFEAYEWAKRSAELGLPKAEYAMGYFTEMGIGCRRDPLEANVWYVRAADQGDERAKHRIAAIRAAASGGEIPMKKKVPKFEQDGGWIDSGRRSPQHTKYEGREGKILRKKDKSAKAAAKEGAGGGNGGGGRGEGSGGEDSPGAEKGKGGKKWGLFGGGKEH